MPLDKRFINPVRDSFQEIDENSWLWGKKVLISRQPSPGPGPSWSDGNGAFYALSDPPEPLPPTRPLSATSEIVKVYDAGDAAVAWKVGEAYCKVKILEPKTTREHVTLEYLHQKRPLSFAIPDTVYYHAEGINDRYYIIVSKVAGQTLNEVWYQMDETMQQHCISRITEICEEMAVWRGDSMSGIDGGFLSEYYLRGRSWELTPASLLDTCQALGMDCSTLVFYHTDLGPGNVLVDTTDGSIGIIDWETAGFVPRDWIRTKFSVSGGFDLPGDDMDIRVDWRRRVQLYMGAQGFKKFGEELIAFKMRERQMK